MLVAAGEAGAGTGWQCLGDVAERGLGLAAVGTPRYRYLITYNMNIGIAQLNPASSLALAARRRASRCSSRET